jgi:Asp-tRNA(Asn)/Glu-tRNA(Gln) amidotransferase A subunit family amidase
MIRPAAFCGVVGFKPTRGLLSRAGMQLTCESLDVIGWYGANIAQALAVGRVLLPSRECSGKSLADLKVALLSGNPGHLLQPEAAEALTAAAVCLKNSGVQLRQVAALTVAEELLRTHSTLMLYELSRSLQAQVEADHGQLSDQLLDAVRRGRHIEGHDYINARASQARLKDCWEAQFGAADLVLTSSALGDAPKGLHYTGDSAFNKGWSVLGWPCLHLPTTQSSAGLPLGVLLVAKPFCDLDLLEWAESIHQVIDDRNGALPSIHQDLGVNP